MAAAAEAFPSDWLGRLIEDLSCGWAKMSGPRTRPGKAWGGPAWGFGPPSGGWGGSGGEWWSGGAARPRAGRGDVRSAILALLREGPRHGYQIIQDIGERSGGAWRASPGSVYPALAALQDEGLVDDEKLEGRRMYSLTQAGRDHVAQRQAELDGVFAAFSGSGDAGQDEDYGRLLFSVGAAAVEVARTGTPEQAAAARALLAKVRRDLYGLLADDDGAAAAEDLS